MPPRASPGGIFYGRLGLIRRQVLSALLAEPAHIGVPADVIAAGLRHVVFHRDGVARPEPAQQQHPPAPLVRIFRLLPRAA